MFKKVIRVELDERYFNKVDLTNAVVVHLKGEGNECELINGGIILLNGEKYSLREKNYAAIFPVQIAELVKIED